MAGKKSPAPLTKREKFERSGRFGWKKVAVIAAVIVVAAGGFTGYKLATRAPQVGGAVVEQSGVTYSDTASVPMVLVTDATVNADTVELSATEVKTDKIVGLLYTRTKPMPAGYDDLPDNGLPVLAYVAPSGRLVVASSLCEPCHSYNFHIEGNTLVCNACFTKWDLDTLAPVSGGCQDYPPMELQASVQGDTVVIDRSALESWEPRI